MLKLKAYTRGGWGRWIIFERFSQRLKVKWKAMKNQSIENIVQPIKNYFKFDSRKSTSCFHETIGCLYQQNWKTMLKQFMSVGVERITQDVYTGSLLSKRYI